MPVTHLQLPFTGQDELREDLARGGLKTSFTLRTPSGWKTIDSPWEPRGEATRALARLTEGGSEVLLLGSGSGFFAEELVERGIASALIVGASPALCERTIKRLEKEGGVGEKTVLLLVSGSDPEQVWSETVQPWLAEHPNAAIVQHPREFQAMQGYFQPIAVHVALRDRPAYKPSSKVLLLGSGGLMERELAGELRQRGFEVAIDSPPAGQNLTAEQALEMLDRHSPSVVLSTNLLGSDLHGVLPEVCQQIGIGWASWLLDDPRFLMTPESAAGAGRERIALCWDRNGVDGWSELGFTRAEPLPLATDPVSFEGAKPVPELEGRIVFVGSPMFASAEGFFHLLEQDEHAAPLADQLAPEIERTRIPPTPARIEELLKAEGLEGQFDPEAQRRLAAWAVQRANRAYRIRMLTALAPLKPIVYGRGWEGLLPSEVELRDPLAYDEQLPSVYASDAVHLSLTNLQMRAWPNQRLFDVPAAGGCVIGDRLEGLEELFGPAIEPLTFGDESELVELATRLTADRELRQRLAADLREVVLARHTIAHRVDRILEILNLSA